MVKGDNAILFDGGVPLVSPVNSISFSSSALRLVPASLDSRNGDCEGDFDSESLNAAGGGVPRETDNDAKGPSGVPERLLPVVVRNRAARLLVDVKASA